MDDLKDLTHTLGKIGKGADAISKADIKKSGGFLDKIKKSQRKYLNQLNFSFDLETDQIRVNSEKLDVDGEPLIQFIILGDGTILPLKLGSDVTEEELETRQAALAWVICYIFIGFFGLTLAGFYAFFRAQNQAKNENFLDFLAK